MAIPGLSQVESSRQVQLPGGSAEPARQELPGLPTSPKAQVFQAAQGIDLTKNVQLASGDYVDKAEYEALSEEIRTKLDELGVEGYNKWIVDTQEQFEADNVKLSSGEYVSKTEYSSLPSEYQSKLSELGIEGFNSWVASEKEAFESSHVQLGSGEWVSQEDWDSLDSTQQGILSTQGISGLDQFHAENIQLETGWFPKASLIEVTEGQYIQRSDLSSKELEVYNAGGWSGLQSFRDKYVQLTTGEWVEKGLYFDAGDGLISWSDLNQMTATEKSTVMTQGWTGLQAYYASIQGILDKIPKVDGGYDLTSALIVTPDHTVGVSSWDLVRAGFSQADVDAAQRRANILQALYPYEAEGGYDLSKALKSGAKVFDTSSATWTTLTTGDLKYVGFTDADIQQAIAGPPQPSVWSRISNFVQGMIPVYGTVKYWNSMPTWQKVLSVGADVLVIVPMVGAVAKIGTTAPKVSAVIAPVTAWESASGLVKSSLSLKPIISTVKSVPSFVLDPMLGLKTVASSGYTFARELFSTSIYPMIHPIGATQGLWNVVTGRVALYPKVARIAQTETGLFARVGKYEVPKSIKGVPESFVELRGPLIGSPTSDLRTPFGVEIIRPGPKVTGLVGKAKHWWQPVESAFGASDLVLRTPLTIISPTRRLGLFPGKKTITYIESILRESRLPEVFHLDGRTLDTGLWSPWKEGRGGRVSTIVAPTDIKSPTSYLGSGVATRSPSTTTMTAAQLARLAGNLPMVMVVGSPGYASGETVLTPLEWTTPSERVRTYEGTRLGVVPRTGLGLGTSLGLGLGFATVTTPGVAVVPAVATFSKVATRPGVATRLAVSTQAKVFPAEAKLRLVPPIILPGAESEGGEADYVTLTTASNPSSAGITSAGGVFKKGRIVKVSTKTLPGYRFVHWEGDVPSGKERVTNFSLNMDRDKHVIAVFEPAKRKTVPAMPGITIHIPEPLGKVERPLEPRPVVRKSKYKVKGFELASMKRIS